MKKAIKVMVVITCLILVAMLFRNYVKDYKLKEKVEDKVISEEEILQKEYEQQLNKAYELQQVVFNNTEIILLTVSDNYVVSHKRLKDGFFSLLVGSNVSLNIRYTAVISIPNDALEVKYTGNSFEIVYDLSKMNIKSIQIDNITSEYKYGLIAKRYTPSEISALTLIATEQVKENLSQDKLLKFTASQNLVNYLQNQAYKYLIFDIVIKEKTLE